MNLYSRHRLTLSLAKELRTRAAILALVAPLKTVQLAVSVFAGFYRLSIGDSGSFRLIGQTGITYTGYRTQGFGLCMGNTGAEPRLCLA